MLMRRPAAFSVYASAESGVQRSSSSVITKVPDGKGAVGVSVTLSIVSII